MVVIKNSPSNIDRLMILPVPSGAMVPTVFFSLGLREDHTDMLIAIAIIKCNTENIDEMEGHYRLQRPSADLHERGRMVANWMKTYKHITPKPGHDGSTNYTVRVNNPDARNVSTFVVRRQLVFVIFDLYYLVKLISFPAIFTISYYHILD